ncbi:MAG: outer membrane protein assembly factor BamD [Sphingomicrobium sp.]
MFKLSRTIALLAAGAAAISLAGCAANKAKGDTAYVARDVNTLYAAAKRTMDSADYEQAAKLFDEVERQHPYSAWARRAQLMSAFNYYLAKKYNESVGAARRFVTIHPGNSEAPYAQYLIAMSYYQQIEDVTRDQASTQLAADSFGELIRRHPNTRYAADARLKLDLINDHLAGKEMEIGRFYQRSANWLAATYRFRNVTEKYQTTSHTPEALERLVETYLALGIPDEALKAAAVLGRNYPETYWYRQSLRLLLKGRKLEERLASLPNGGRVRSYPAGKSPTSAPARPKATAYPDLIKPPQQ